MTNEDSPFNNLFKLCTRFGVAHSYQVVGVPIPRSASQVSA